LNHDKTDPGLLAQYKSELPDFTLDDVIGSPVKIKTTNKQTNKQTIKQSNNQTKTTHSMPLFVIQ